MSLAQRGHTPWLLSNPSLFVVTSHVRKTV
jgi:hypothetical protein